MKQKKINSKTANILKNSTILITGGAGSFGAALTEELVKYPVKAIRILDIDEHALFKLKHKINDKRIKFLLCTILDSERIDMAGQNVDIIIHLAAIKNIEISEFNPIEAIDTNINGLTNLIKMAIKNKPKIFLNISTDKAVHPSTLYGSTKLLAERLTSWAGFHLSETKFGTVRFGNLMESRGNVFEIWEDESKNKKPLSITDKSMKRYFLHIDEASKFLLSCLPLINLGEIIVPKMKSYKITDLANKISKNHKIIGIREGEKLNEDLISDSEKDKSLEKDDYWIIKN